MEVTKCSLCGKPSAWFGVEEWGILGFSQEYEGEEFVFEELYDQFVQNVIEKE